MIEVSLWNITKSLCPDFSVWEAEQWLPEVSKCPGPGNATLHGRGILQTELTTLRWRDNPALPWWANSITRILMAGMWGELVQFSSVAQCVRLFVTPWTTAHQAPRPSPTPGVYLNLCPLSRWCHPTISSSVVPFSSCPQSCPASGSFQISQLFTSGGQSIGFSASASVLPRNTQDWFPLGWTAWISLQSKGLSKVFSNTTGQKHQFFGAQLSL